ncbi:non-ribosomal peptide synthetase [Streptomyces sp. Tu 3180]|uniref:non-ribosomal peptide synthetase n=1 Tax=Streptomyces sp. Tu 3180 TaxID=2682611 RepID=UPI0013572ECD|nr:non-ribosomal peptide synthetase [Streptomyces sp. Tu 3180]KAF3468913.1 amino acid adenylation domain-containing protein [Streptomyces sp. Tu 3180]
MQSIRHDTVPRPVRSSAAEAPGRWEDVFPLTDVQEAYYVGRFMEPESAAAIYVEFEADGLDPSAAEDAWNDLVAETGMLRAEVLPDGRQGIRASVPRHRVPVTDLREADEATRTAELERLRAEGRSAAFDVHRWPLFSVTVALLPGGRSRVHLAVDEMAVDGPSVPLLLHRWYALHHGRREPAAPEFGFGDYVRALRAREDGDRTRAALAYWRRKLSVLDPPSGADAAGPDTGAPEDAVPAPARRRLTLRLPGDAWRRVGAHASALRVTPSALLLTLYGGLLHRTGAARRSGWTAAGGGPVPVVVTTYNRLPLHPDIARVVGPFVSTSVFLAPEPAGPPARLAGTVRDQLWADLEHGAVSGVRALRETARARGRTVAVPPPFVFTSMLGTLGGAAPGAGPRDAGWAGTAATEAGRTRTPGVWLECLLHEVRGELHVSLDCDEERLGPGVADDLLSRLGGALETLARTSPEDVAALDDPAALLDAPADANGDGPRDAASPADVNAEADATSPAGAGLSAWAAVEGADAADGLPLTPLQTAYLVGRTTMPGAAGETRVHQEFRLPRPDLDRLTDAWRLLVRHHPALRARVRADGTLTVEPAPADPALPRVPHHDLSDVTAEEAEEALARRRARLATTPMPLEDGPLWRLETSGLPDGSVVLHVLLDALVADARAVALLFEQLFRLHAGEAPARVLSGHRVPFAAFLRDRDGASRGPAAEAARAEWDALLRTAPAGPSPVRRGPGSSGPGGAGGDHRRLDLPRWRVLRRLAERWGVPLDVLLLTVYCDVWRRACPDGEAFTVVVVSWDRPARPPGADALLADFTRLSWLVVDDTLPAGPADRARAVAERLRGQLSRAERADGLAAARERARREPGGTSPFPVVFTRLPAERPARGGPGVELRYSQSQTSGVAVDQVPMFVGDTLVCQWDVRPDALPDGLLDTLFSDYARTLGDLCERDPEHDPAPAPPQAPLVGPVRDFAAGLTLADRLERALAEHADRVALRSGEEELTYRELGLRSARLARYLRAGGVGVADRVAVHLERSVDLVVALLAVVRSGAAYVPLDTANPPARTRLLAEDCEARLVITDSGLRTVFDGLPVRVLDVTARRERIDAEDGGPLVAGAGPDDPAYMIYTSGTTGRPKGCPNAHRGVANRLHWAQERFRLGPGDRVAQKTPCGFDVSVWEFFWPLLAGASVVLARPGAHRSPAATARWFAEAGITVSHFVPSMLSLFLDEPGAARATSLRLVLASGEALPADTVRRFQAVLPGVGLHNLYGPTEAAIDVTHWACPPGWSGTDVPLGGPIDNTVIHLLDAGLRPVAAGDVGEICVGGPAVGLGYHRRPEAEAERFVDSPFPEDRSSGGSGRLYRTGDLGRVDEHGRLRFLGRRDDQFKIRGLRVEAQEIEAALRGVAGVDDARVLPWTGPGGDRELAALCRGTAARRPSAAAVREELSRVLPAALVPSRLVFAPHLPLTTNGKLDRAAALRLLETGDAPDAALAPSGAGAPGAGRVQPGGAARDGRGDGTPATAGERASGGAARAVGPDQVARVAARLLGVEHVAGDADLFRLGATSFTMIRLAQEIRRRYGVDVPLEALVQRPTPAGVAAAATAPEDGDGTGGARWPGAEEVAAVAAPLLGRREIGPDEDLFALGATSFTMIRLAQEIRRRYGGDVPVDVLVSRPTARGVAEGLTRPDTGTGSGTDPGTGTPGGAPSDAPDVRIAFDAEAKAAFKAERRSLRRFGPDRLRVALDLPPDRTPPARPVRSVREFADGPVDLRSLSLLALAFAELGPDGDGRRPYPSAGGLYPVQVYVYVKPGRVTGAAPGVYYLDPVDRALVLLAGGAVIDAECHVRYNRPVFEGSAFGLFLVATPRAIAPAYGRALATRYTAIEAGHMAQAAMERAGGLRLGLCPVGDMDFASVRGHFALDDGQDLLVSLWGGPLPEEDDAAGKDHVAGDAVAVVGFAARLPGTDPADGVGGLARMLAEGRTAIGPPPPGRAPHRPLRTDRGGATVGAYLADVEDDEPGESGITDDTAPAVDPQERLLLATVRACLENAAVRADRLSAAGPVGVFTGAMWHDHARGRGSSPERAAAVPTGTGLAHRVSHVFDLRGPSLVVDSGCASGLAAVEAAVRSLRSGQCTAAVAAAANLVLDPSHLEFLAEAGLLAESAGSRPFSDRSDGWIPGEGIGAVLLKPLARALADGDPVLAVVRGGACRHSGRTRDYGMPGPGRLEETVRAALADAGVDPGAIGYAETSATGAALNDALELDVLGRVFGDRPRPLPVGSVKGVLGHMEAASGFGQLARVLAQFRRGRLLPTPVPDGTGALAGGGGRVRLVRGEEDADPPRLVLVNSFAGTGGYVSLVVEAPPRAAAGPAPDVPVTLPLSADTPAELARYAERLADHLEEERPPLTAVVAALVRGRRPRDCRAAVVATAEGAVRALRELAARAPAEGSGLLVRAAGDAPPRLPDGWLAGASAPWPAATGRAAALPPTPVPVRKRSADTDAAPGPEAPPPGPAADRALRRTAAIVARVTGLPAGELAASTDLMSLGVDSLRLVRIARAIAEEGGRPPSLTALYEQPVLGPIAEAAFGTTVPEAPPGPPGDPGARPGPRPPAGPDAGTPDVDAPHVDALDVDALNEAELDALLARHAGSGPLPTAAHRPAEET